MSIAGTLLDIISEAWRELKRARLRTYLAALGIVLGAMGFTVLICSLHLENALRNLQDTNEIYIRFPQADDLSGTVFRRKTRLKRHEFIPADGEAVQEECPSVAQVLIRGTIEADLKGKIWRKHPLSATNTLLSPHFRGSGPPPKLAWGRDFSPEEIVGSAHVVVIDERMNTKLWPREYRPEGISQPGSRFMHINGIRFQVVGVLETKLASGEVATIPYTTMRDLFWDAEWWIDAVAKPGLRKEAGQEIDAVLLRRIGDPGASYVLLQGLSYDELKVYTFFGIMGILVLFAGGMAVSNKAYVDALERSQQFAIRRALGATKQRIYAIVLTEGALLCAFGCFYGGLIGWMIFAAFSAWKWIERSIWMALPLLPLAGMFVFVIALGVAGSLQGAAIAARANPAEVLARKDAV